jgi:hypothetical protein
MSPQELMARVFEEQDALDDRLEGMDNVVEEALEEAGLIIDRAVSSIAERQQRLNYIFDFILKQWDEKALDAAYAAREASDKNENESEAD